MPSITVSRCTTGDCGSRVSTSNDDLSKVYVDDMTLQRQADEPLVVPFCDVPKNLLCRNLYLNCGRRSAVIDATSSRDGSSHGSFAAGAKCTNERNVEHTHGARGHLYDVMLVLLSIESDRGEFMAVPRKHNDVFDRVKSFEDRRLLECIPRPRIFLGIVLP